MVKAVFFDIDGTLVSFKTHEVPLSAVECLKALRAKGIKTFVSTGRMLGSINNLGDLQFDGYITLNGGYCYIGQEKVIYKHPIAPEDISALHEYMGKHPFPCSFVTERGIFMNFTNEAADEVFAMLNFPKPPICSLEDLKDDTFYQLIAFFPSGREQEIMALMPHCDATSWTPAFADVVPKGSSKAIGMDKIIEYYGISLEETVAFGDGGNDIPMLSHAGIGVAMGNASDTVKQSADFVTTSVDEDGIFNALKHLNVL